MRGENSKKNMFIYVIAVWSLIFIVAILAGDSSIGPSYDKTQSKYDHIINTMDDNVIELTNQIGPMYDIDPEFLQSIIYHISGNDKNYKEDGKTGLMGLNLFEQSERMTRLHVNDLSDSYANILVGTDYLSELIDIYEDDSLALMVFCGESEERMNHLYNAGDDHDSIYVKIFALTTQLNQLKDVADLKNHYNTGGEQ